MEKIRFWIRKHFGFTQREVNGFIILSFLILLILLVPLVLKGIKPEESTFKRDQEILDSLILRFQSQPPPFSKVNNSPQACQSFDPNTADEKQLTSILGKKISSNLLRYRNRGGKFTSKVQLKKIYGMTDSLYQSLYECISIKHSEKERKEIIVQSIDINKADSVELEKIRGVGKVLASRIIKFRNRLGGYIDKEQYKEIYGISDEARDELEKQTFIDEKFVPVKFNLNEASPSLLYAHPYIGKESAKIILKIRKTDSSISKEDLLQAGIPEEKIAKALPYILF